MTFADTPDRGLTCHPRLSCSRHFSGCRTPENTTAKERRWNL